VLLLGIICQPVCLSLISPSRENLRNVYWRILGMCIGHHTIGVFLETCALFLSRLLYPVLRVDALDVINHCSLILKHFPTISTWERLSSGVYSCMAFNCLIDISFGITVSTRNSELWFWLAPISLIIPNYYILQVCVSKRINICTFWSRLFYPVCV
jgi:hypothetical protein